MAPKAFDQENSWSDAAALWSCFWCKAANGNHQLQCGAQRSAAIKGAGRQRLRQGSPATATREIWSPRSPRPK
eukprot:1027504-Pyramimonas_sp.AAC.1